MGQNLYSWDAEMTADQTLEGLERECSELRLEVRELKTAIGDSELRIINRISQVLAILDGIVGNEPGERL